MNRNQKLRNFVTFMWIASLALGVYHAFAMGYAETEIDVTLAFQASIICCAMAMGFALMEVFSD